MRFSYAALAHTHVTKELYKEKYMIEGPVWLK